MRTSFLRATAVVVGSLSLSALPCQAPALAAFGQGCPGTTAERSYVVLPPLMTRPGNATQPAPLTGSSRLMTIVDQSLLPSFDVIDSISLRPDEMSPFFGGPVELEIRLGASDSAPENAATTFDQNWIGSPHVALRRQTIRMPVSVSPLHGWIRFGLDAPYAVDPQHNLAIDIHGSNATGAILAIDAEDATGDGIGGLIGTSADAVSGTLSTAGAVMLLQGTLTGGAIPQIGATSPYIGHSMLTQVYRARRESTAALFVGLSNRTFGGLALPLDLRGAGAPGCDLLVSVEQSLLATTDSAGFGYRSLAVPNDPNLVGRSIFTQWAINDPGANALGFVFTPGIHATFGQ